MRHFGADDAAGAGAAVVDDHLAAEPLAQIGAEYAAHDVVAAARRERNDQPHWLGRVVLRCRHGREGEQQPQGPDHGLDEQGVDGLHHAFSPVPGQAPPRARRASCPYIIPGAGNTAAARRYRVQIVTIDYSALMPPSLTTRSHFAISATMVAPNAAELMRTASAPSAANCRATSGESWMAAISWCNLSMI